MYVHVFEALRCVYDWKHKCEMLFKVGNSQKVGMVLQFPHPPFPPAKWLETISRDSPQVTP